MPPTDPTPRLREIRDAQNSALALTPERNRLIKVALSMGYSERKVARDAGLSPSRIHAIALTE